MRKMRYNLEWEISAGGDEDPIARTVQLLSSGNFFPTGGAGSKVVTKVPQKDEVFLQHYL